MIRFTKGILLAAIVLFGAVLFIPCRVMAQEDPSKQCVYMAATGTVSAVDWVGNLLVVNTGGDDLSLVVDRDTVFKKGSSNITFAEVNQVDSVTVKYTDCNFAGLKAVSVTVTSGY
jgi:hypothetical protein